MQDVKTVLMLRKKQSENVVEDGFLIMNFKMEYWNCLFCFFFFGASHIFTKSCEGCCTKESCFMIWLLYVLSISIRYCRKF
jgi:hypothetical protein